MAPDQVAPSISVRVQLMPVLGRARPRADVGFHEDAAARTETLLPSRQFQMRRTVALFAWMSMPWLIVAACGLRDLELGLLDAGKRRIIGGAGDQVGAEADSADVAERRRIGVQRSGVLGGTLSVESYAVPSIVVNASVIWATRRSA